MKDPLQVSKDDVLKDVDAGTSSRTAAKDDLQMMKSSVMIKEETVDIEDADVGTSSRTATEDDLQMMNSSVMIKEESVESKENVHVWAVSGIH